MRKIFFKYGVAVGILEMFQTRMLIWKGECVKSSQIDRIQRRGRIHQRRPEMNAINQTR